MSGPYYEFRIMKNPHGGYKIQARQLGRSILESHKWFFSLGSLTYKTYEEAEKEMAGKLLHQGPWEEATE